MGLDTYAYHFVEETTKSGSVKKSLKPIDDESFAKVANVLAGGIFSGTGACSSFRGKVYDSYVTFVTGETLHQQEIPAKTVEKMASMLESFYVKCSADRQLFRATSNRSNGISLDEMKALAQWFKVVSEHKGIVTGWW